MFYFQKETHFSILTRKFQVGNGVPSRIGYFLKTHTLTDLTVLTDFRLISYREKVLEKIFFFKIISITFSKYLSVLSYLSYCNNTLEILLSKQLFNTFVLLTDIFGHLSAGVSVWTLKKEPINLWTSG